MLDKQTSKIMACMNTHIDKVKLLLKKEGFELQMLFDPYKEIKKQKNIIFGFTSSENMIPLLPQLKHPPILWEAATVLYHISLNQPIVFLDAKILRDGLVTFHEISQEKLAKFAKKEFVHVSQIQLEKSKATQFGNNSKLSILLNNFLSTLPVYVYEPTLIALISALELGKFKMFTTYIEKNRIVTNENKKQFSEFVEYLTEIKPYVKMLVKKDVKGLRKITDMEIKFSVQRMKFLFTYFGSKKLTDYLDPEDNVNVKSKE